MAHSNRSAFLALHDLKTTLGEVFPGSDSALLAYLIFRRFGRDLALAHQRWSALLGNNATLDAFRELVEAGGPPQVRPPLDLPTLEVRARWVTRRLLDDGVFPVDLDLVLDEQHLYVVVLAALRVVEVDPGPNPTTALAELLEQALRWGRNAQLAPPSPRLTRDLHLAVKEYFKASTAARVADGAHLGGPLANLTDAELAQRRRAVQETIETYSLGDRPSSPPVALLREDLDLTAEIFNRQARRCAQEPAGAPPSPSPAYQALHTIARQGALVRRHNEDPDGDR